MDKQRLLGVVMGGSVVVCGVAGVALARNNSSLALPIVGVALTVVGVASIVGSVTRWAFLVRRPGVIISAYLPLMGLLFAIQADTGTAKALWSLFTAGGIVLLLVSLRPADQAVSQTRPASTDGSPRTTASMRRNNVPATPVLRGEAPGGRSIDLRRRVGDMAPSGGRERLRPASRTELVLLVLVAVITFAVGWVVGSWFIALALCGAAVGVCGGVIGYRRLTAAE